ncbi:MAG: GGDEF domain-containing protein [Nakamurella sp.]
MLFAQREMLLALSSVDPLTGLMNRRTVDAELARTFEYWQRSGTPLAVLMVDIDHFKTLNDSQGHIAGDHALRLVADVVRETMPLASGQVAARYGGEEFICMLPGLGAAEAAAVARQILKGGRRIGIPLTATEGDQTILTVSAGVASAHPPMDRPEALVNAADQQLYRAKAAGRNCLRAEPAALTA